MSQFTIKTSMIFFLMLGLTFDLKSKNDVPTDNTFEFKLLLDDDRIVHLAKVKGPVWDTLSYSCDDVNCTKFISERGVSPEKNSDDASFLIEVNKNDRDIKMTCHEGCAWEDLTIDSIHSSNEARIGYYGVKP